MISIDGSQGEGGGQIVRSALALSALTGTPFKVTGIRSNRPVPGLKAQHLTALEVLRKLCDAEVSGSSLGALEISFAPKTLRARRVDVDIGTAGSITLLLQSLLLPALFAPKRSVFTITGGTDVAWSMTADFLKEVVAPQYSRYAEKLDIDITRRGYYPAGQGRLAVRVDPKWSVSDFPDFDAFMDALRKEGPKLSLLDRHNLVQVKGVSHAGKDLEGARVAERQANSAREALASLKCPVDIRTEYVDSSCTGSGITLWAVCSKDPDDIDTRNPVRLGADALGEKGKPAEDVGRDAAERLKEELRSGAAVDRHTADNLVPLLGLSCPGNFRTSVVTEHCRTNASVVERFIPSKFSFDGNIVRSECRGK